MFSSPLPRTYVFRLYRRLYERRGGDVTPRKGGNRRGTTGGSGEQPELSGDRDGLGAGTDVKLAEEPLEVPLHRLLGQEEALPDLAVAQSLGDQLQDLGFPAMEPLGGSGRGSFSGDRIAAFLQ